MTALTSRILRSMPEYTSMDVAQGVEVSGLYNPGSPGNRVTPPTDSWVDTDSLSFQGRPDRVAKYFESEGVDPLSWMLPQNANFTESLATELREHHEKNR